MTFSKICYPIINSIMSLQSFAPRAIWHFVHEPFGILYKSIYLVHTNRPTRAVGCILPRLYTLHSTPFPFHLSPLTHTRLSCARRWSAVSPCLSPAKGSVLTQMPLGRCISATQQRVSKPQSVPKDYDQFAEHLKQFGTNAGILQNAETIWCDGLPKQDVREMDKTGAAMLHIGG